MGAGCSSKVQEQGARSKELGARSLTVTAPVSRRRGPGTWPGESMGRTGRSATWPGAGPGRTGR